MGGSGARPYLYRNYQRETRGYVNKRWPAVMAPKVKVVPGARVSESAEGAARGMMIGHNGFWITVHARRIGFTLVTNNAREVRRVLEFALSPIRAR
jgi:hypothetical protein